MKARYLFILFLLLAGFNTSAYAVYIPFVNNQPIAFKSCPIDRAVSTQSLFGHIGSMNVECVIDGINVVYTVTVPPGCEKGGCGLILDNHGMSMNAFTQNQGTKLRQYGWTAKSYGAPTPFIVVQPNLTDVFDREKLLDFDSFAGGAYYNELENIAYFTQHMIDIYNTDTNRTHMYGFSRGGNTANAFYCETVLSEMFASYAMGGQDFRCPPDKPLLMIVGDTDSNHLSAIDDAEAKVLSMGNVAINPIVNNPSYSSGKWEFKWRSGFQYKGLHHHIRYTRGDFILETIRHSGTTLPMQGHCHPTKDYSSWLTCYSNMETGRKVIDFFIQNPR